MAVLWTTTCPCQMDHAMVFYEQREKPTNQAPRPSNNCPCPPQKKTGYPPGVRNIHASGRIHCHGRGAIQLLHGTSGTLSTGHQLSDRCIVQQPASHHMRLGIGHIEPAIMDAKTTRLQKWQSLGTKEDVTRDAEAWFNWWFFVKSHLGSDRSVTWSLGIKYCRVRQLGESCPLRLK